MDGMTRPGWRSDRAMATRLATIHNKKWIGSVLGVGRQPIGKPNDRPRDFDIQVGGAGPIIKNDLVNYCKKVNELKLRLF